MSCRPWWEVGGEAVTPAPLVHSLIWLSSSLTDRCISDPDRVLTVDGIEVRATEEGPPNTRGSSGTLRVDIGSHECRVGYRGATRPGRYYYRCVFYQYFDP